MELKIKKDKRSEIITINAEKDATVQNIVNQFQKDLPYRILAAKKNNQIVELTEKIEKPCTIEFLDMRDQATNLIYQHSLCLIYLKAVRDVIGNVIVEIENSLNKGLYTNIRTIKPITAAEIKAVEERMHCIVNEDIPVKKEVATREEAMNIFVDNGHVEKARRIQDEKHLQRIKFYSIEDYKNFFYGLMVPSTGYVELFELKKYRRGVLLRFPHQSDPSIIPKYVDEKKMYDAFGEATRWGKLMGVSYAMDLNEKVENGEYKELVQLSEALHEKKIAEIADMISKSGKRIVLIAGPSSSGKTTFARRLCIQLRVNGLEPLYMGTDDYFVERSETPRDEYGQFDFESLRSVDVELFNRNMNDLLDGKSVDLPAFDFMTGSKIFGKRITSIKKDQPIVIEGIHGLNEAMTPYIPREEKFKIYISPLTQLNIDNHNRIPTTDVRMLRRMTRDFQFRGHSAQQTIDAWPQVRAGEDKYIFPYNGEADVFFNSVHIYEIAVLKKYAQPLLEAIKPEEPQYSEAIRMLKFLAFFKPIEDDSIIVNNSIIREFIGGSIFV